MLGTISLQSMIGETKRMANIPVISRVGHLKIVYGGKHTVLINKFTRKRICKVTREDNEPDSLVRATLYLLLKWYGIGGKQIQEWADKWMLYVTLHMRAEFDAAFLKWMIQNAWDLYTEEEINDILNSIYDSWPECKIDRFMLFLVHDRMGITRDDIFELVHNAICSEKMKEESFGEKLLKGKIDSINCVSVNKIDI